MSLTLEVSPAIEKALEQKARRRGVALETYAAQILEREAVEATNGEAQAKSTPATPRERMFGKYAFVGGTVDDFLREKHEEIEREEAEWERRHAARNRARQLETDKDAA